MTRRIEKHCYSITSSARARIAPGTFSPSAFATVTLIAMSNFVGCWTGRSPGFTPRGAPEQVREVGSVGDEPAGRERGLVVKHRRQPRAQRQDIDAVLERVG